MLGIHTHFCVSPCSCRTGGSRTWWLHMHTHWLGAALNFVPTCYLLKLEKYIISNFESGSNEIISTCMNRSNTMRQTKEEG